MKKLLTVAMAVAVVGLSSPLVAAQQNNNGNNAGGGNLDCPDGTVLLAKYNFGGGAYAAESGGTVVSISNGTATSGDFTVTDPTKEVTAVVVKGSTDAKIDTYNPGVTSGSFDNSGLQNNGGNTPAISNVKFCGGDKTEPETPEVPETPETPEQPVGGRGGVGVQGSQSDSDSTSAPSAASPTTNNPAETTTQVPAGSPDAGGSGSIAATIGAFTASLAGLGYGLLRIRNLNS